MQSQNVINVDNNGDNGNEEERREAEGTEEEGTAKENDEIRIHENVDQAEEIAKLSTINLNDGLEINDLELLSHSEANDIVRTEIERKIADMRQRDLTSKKIWKEESFRVIIWLGLLCSIGLFVNASVHVGYEEEGGWHVFGEAGLLSLWLVSSWLVRIWQKERKAGVFVRRIEDILVEWDTYPDEYPVLKGLIDGRGVIGGCNDVVSAVYVLRLGSPLNHSSNNNH